MEAHQAPPSLGFSRQEHWSGLPFPSPMHESEKWKWSCSVVSDYSWPHGLQPTRLLCPWDFPGKSTGVGCHCLLRPVSYITPNKTKDKEMPQSQKPNRRNSKVMPRNQKPNDSSPRGWQRDAQKPKTKWHKFPKCEFPVPLHLWPGRVSGLF